MTDLAWLPGDTAASRLAPVVVAGSSPAARARAVRDVEAAGLRLACAVGVEQAVERLDQQVATSLVWVELDRDGGRSLDGLLERIDRDADAGRYGAIVAAGGAMIDPIAARIGSARVDVLLDARDDERVAALALATALPRPGGRLSDIASDNSAARLRQLSDEVGRIAATLARLSHGPGAAPGLAPVPMAPSALVTPGDLGREQVHNVIRARRLRARFFPEDMFADPAWDILLDLLQAEIAQIRVPVSSLCIAAAVPATTALRWIKTLTDNGMLVRRADPHDGRRVFVEMSQPTSDAMRRYFAEMGKICGI